MKPRSLLFGLTASALLLSATAAPAQTDDEAFALALSPAKAGRSAKLGLAGQFDGKKVIDQVRFSLPPGSKFDTGAVEQCNKSGQEIEQAGGPEKACSKDAEIGSGEAVALVGGNPLKIPLRVWNRRNAMIINFQVGDSGFFAISPIRGRTITVSLSQAPALDARATEFTLGIGRTPNGEDPYFRTPRTCSRSWKSSLTYRTFQGGNTTLKDTTRCSKR
jgi:hypothetical protein